MKSILEFLDGTTLYKKIVEKGTVKFLTKDLDEMRGRIMGIKPFPTLQEAFSKVRRFKRRNTTNTTSPIES